MKGSNQANILIKGKGGGWKALHAHVQTSMILIVGNSQNLDTYHISMLLAEPILLGYFHSPVLPGFFSQDDIEVYLLKILSTSFFSRSREIVAVGHTSSLPNVGNSCDCNLPACHQFVHFPNSAISSSSDWLIVYKGWFDWTLLMGLMLMHHSKEHVRKTAARKKSCKPEVRAQFSFCRKHRKGAHLREYGCPTCNKSLIG